MRLRTTVTKTATTAALLLAATGCAGPPASETTAPTASGPAGPSRLEAQVPVGYPRTAEGARAAASRYVAVLGGPVGLDASRRDLALAAVSRDGRPAEAVAARWATRPTVERATGVQQALRTGAPVVAAAVPVLSQVSAYDGQRATVTVWATAVLGTTRLGSLEQSWATETLTLLWSGDWKLAAYDSAPGPVPVTSQSATPLADALARTAGLRGIFDAAP